MSWPDNNNNISSQEFSLLGYIDYPGCKRDPELKSIFERMLIRVHSFKEVRTLQDIALRKVLQKKLEKKISEDDDKLLDRLLKIYNPDKLTFDTLDLIYQIYKKNYSYPKWYWNRFCKGCNRTGDILGYTREDKGQCIKCAGWDLFLHSDDEEYYAEEYDDDDDDNFWTLNEYFSCYN